MNLRVGPCSEEAGAICVYFGDLLVCFRPDGVIPERLASIVAYAFATKRYHAPKIRLLRSDAGPKGLERYLKRHQGYFETAEKARDMGEQLMPFVEEALVAYGVA